MENDARKKALRNIKSLSSDFSSGGVKETSPDDYKRLTEQYKNVGKSAKEQFAGDDLSKMRELMGQTKGLDQRGKLAVTDYLRNRLSSNPLQTANLNQDLSNIKGMVRGGNPPIEEPIKIPGREGGHIQDISRVKGQIPVDMSRVVNPSGTTGPGVSNTTIKEVTDHIKSPGLMKEVSGGDFAAKQAKLAAEAEARLLAKKSALMGLKGAGKKMFGALIPGAGIAQALASGDVMAAAPIPGLESEALGEGSDVTQASAQDRPMDGGYMTPERQRRLAEMLKAGK